MTAGLLEIVEMLAAYHAAVLGGLLIARRISAGLGLLCLGFAVHMAFNLGTATGWIPAVADITSAFGLLYGPIFYLFVRGLARKDGGLQPVDALHALPALAIAALRPADPIPQIIGLPSLVIYITLALLALRGHRRVSAELRADDEAVSLRWVEHALLAFAALAVLEILREVTSQTYPVVPDDIALSIVIAGVIGLFTVMGWRARQHARQSGAVEVGDASAAKDGKAARAAGDPDAEARFPVIDALIREKVLWKEMRLSLADIAQHARMTPRDVSRAINAGSGLSFSRYINGIRIEAVDTLMADPANAGRTVIELAYEAGFNSKSAFNRIYREQTGRTPTEAFAAAKFS